MTDSSKTAESNRLPAEIRALQSAFLLGLLVVLWIIYRPGLPGPFLFDDYENIGGNPYLAIDELSLKNLIGVIFSRSEGISNRPLAMLTFAFNYYFSGQTFNVFNFKLTNLAIHAANVVLVYVLIRLLLVTKFVDASTPEAPRAYRRSVWVAALTAGLWGLHPLQLTSVLYVVQRMNSLSAFFVLAGLLVFAVGRQRFERRPMNAILLMGAGLAGGVGLGFMCKENAILLPGFAVIVELVFFTRTSLSLTRFRQLALFYALLLGIPALFSIGFIIADPWFIPGSYFNREFTLTERVMTEARVLFFYASLIFFPLLSRFGIFHDDFQLSTGLLAPGSTLAAVVAWLLLLAALLPGLRRRSLWAFGIGWFLVGHLLESTVIGLELVHEHRNYLPSIGPLAAAAFYFCVLAEKIRMDRKLFVLMALSVLLVVAFVTHSRAAIWSTRLSLFEYEARNHPTSSRALSEFANVMSDQGADIRVTYKLYRDAARVDPSAVHTLIMMQKIIQVLIAATSESYPQPAPSGSGAATEVNWFEDLVIEPSRLLLNDQAVSREITRRLNTVRPSTATLGFLRRTQGCTLAGHVECLRIIDRIIDWHEIVIRRLPYSGRQRAVAELSLARILAFQGDTERAFKLVDEAIASSSGHPVYRAEKAILLARLGRTQEAAAIVTDIERNQKYRRQHARDLEIVREVIRQMGASSAPAQ